MNAHYEPLVQSPCSSEVEYPDLPSLDGRYSSMLMARHSRKVFELVKGIGSPLHCVFPQQFSENIAHMRAVVNKHRLSAKIFFAKKANKAQSFSLMCREAHIGIDVASKQELELALAAGISGEFLGVSGPEKDSAFLQLAIAQGAQIAVNSLEELQKIISLSCRYDDFAIDIAHRQTFKPIIVLRFQPECEKSSRFGIASTKIPVALNMLRGHQQRVKLLGFSFHLSGYDIHQRTDVTSELVKWIIAAREMGFSYCNQLNIGGGLPVKYTTTDQWVKFLRSTKAGHFHRNQSFIAGFYPYGNKMHSAEALDLLLSTPTQTHLSLAHQLRENHIQLAIEPGRALLDQAGVSIFSIQGMKLIESEYDYWIATVAGMSFSLSEQWFGSEFLPSPSLLKASVFEGDHRPVTQSIYPTAIAGSSCLECDMVSWRKIPFAVQPAVNDCLVYHNTAGYQMDSNESTFHSVPIVPKVAMWFDEQDVHWQLDSHN